MFYFENVQIFKRGSPNLSTILVKIGAFWEKENKL